MDTTSTTTAHYVRIKTINQKVVHLSKLKILPLVKLITRVLYNNNNKYIKLLKDVRILRISPILLFYNDLRYIYYYVVTQIYNYYTYIIL